MALIEIEIIYSEGHAWYFWVASRNKLWDFKSHYFKHKSSARRHWRKFASRFNVKNWKFV